MNQALRDMDDYTERWHNISRAFGNVHPRVLWTVVPDTVDDLCLHLNLAPDLTISWSKTAGMSYWAPELKPEIVDWLAAHKIEYSEFIIEIHLTYLHFHSNKLFVASPIEHGILKFRRRRDFMLFKLRWL